MSLTFWIESVDRTAYVKRGSVQLHLRADTRNTCKVTMQSTAGAWLPVVGQDLKVTESRTDDDVGTGDGATTTFYLVAPIEAASETIYLDAVPTAAYTLDDATGALVFAVAPGVGVAITADYTAVPFGGVIKTAPAKRVTKRAPSTSSLVAIAISSDGYHSIPARRSITAAFVSAVDAGDIVNHYITEFLTAEGITAGTIDAGINLPGGYNKGAVSIKDSLDELAQLSGFSWWIDNLKQLHFMAQQPIIDAIHALEEGGVFTDFRDVGVEEQLDNYRNKQFVAGAIKEDGSQYVYELEDAAEIAARAAIAGGTGVHGNIFEDSTINNDIDAAIIATSLLEQFGRVPTVLSWQSQSLDWRGGTRLKANLPTFGLSSDTYFLIDGVNISDSTGSLWSTVTASRRDETDFSTKRREGYLEYFAKFASATKSRVAEASAANKTAATIIVGVAGQSLNSNRADIVVPAAHTNAAPYIQQAIDAMPLVTVYEGTALSGGANFVRLRLGAGSAVDLYNGCEITITGGTGSGQTRTCTTYNRPGFPDPKYAYVSSNWATNPDNTSTLRIRRPAGKVVLLEGIYKTTAQVTLRSGITVEGMGNGTVLAATGASWTANHGILYSQYQSLIQIRNMVLANRNSNCYNGLRSFYGLSQSLVEGVTCLSGGVAGSDARTGIRAQYSFGTLIRNIRAEGEANQGEYGVALTVCFDSSVIGAYVTDYYYAGVSLLNCERCTVASNNLWYGGESGIELVESYDCLVQGNTLMENGWNPGNSQILLTDNSDRNAILGNIVRHNGPFATDATAIYVASSDCDYNLISNNDCYLGGTSDGAIRDDGTDTSFGAGNRVNDGSWLVGEDYVP